MERLKIYVETSIPSFYHETRLSPDMVSRRDWTREWWDGPAKTQFLVTSEAVHDELRAGPPEKSEEWLRLLEDLPLLRVIPEIEGIIEAYQRHKLMPSDPGGDAMHLALASIHQCDFLVTWNCRHLANANKFGHIRGVNTKLGLSVPGLVTPLELLEKFNV